MAPRLQLLILFSCFAGLVTSQVQRDEETEDHFDELIRIQDPVLTAAERKQLSDLIVGDSHAATAELILQGGAMADYTLGAEEESLCSNHTVLMMEAVARGDEWAVRMIDAIGRQPSALLYDGNLRWLGSWEECLAVEPVAYTDPVNKTDPYSPFEPRYCQARFNFKQLLMSRQVTVGMCFPNTCSAAEMKTVADALVPFLQLPEGTLKARSVTCKETDLEFSDKATAVTVVCCLFIAVMVMATVYDFVIILYLNKPVPKAKPEKKKGIGNPLYESTAIDEVEKGKIASDSTSSESSGFSEATPLLSGGDMSQSATQTNALSHHAVDVKKVAPAEVKKTVVEEKVVTYKPGILGRLLLSFSVYTNGSKVLDTTQTPGTLTAVNGIRFLSMAWVILGHTLTFKGQAPDNYNNWINKVIKTWPFQAIANATVSVDTFFVLSGLLVGFLTLKEMKRKGGPRKVNWFLYYFHRFWRLTPPYMLILMVYVPLSGYWGDGPLWNPKGFERNECEKTWWRNLLYINNLVDDKDNGMCMGWSWYLANDMQFYVISPLMLIPLFYSKIAGGVICFALILTNLITTGVMSKHYNFSATPKIDSPRNPPEANSFDTIYIKPYTRIGPYVIGILLGYILYKTNCKVRMNKLVVMVGWAAATAIGLLAVYGPYTSDGTYQMSEEESAFYNAAHRIGWGLAVAWLIFACATGYGGPVNKILSWPGLIPLSRLTYCAYLVHPIVMQTYYYSVRTLQHWYDLEFVYQFLSNLILSMATAFVASLAFESPMMGLEKVLLGRFKK